MKSHQAPTRDRRGVWSRFLWSRAGLFEQPGERERNAAKHLAGAEKQTSENSIRSPIVLGWERTNVGAGRVHKANFGGCSLFVFWYIMPGSPKKEPGAPVFCHYVRVCGRGVLPPPQKKTTKVDAAVHPPDDGEG